MIFPETIVLRIKRAVHPRVFRRLRKRGPAAGPVRRVACYLLLAAAGWVTWGVLAALIVAVVTACLTEGARLVPRPSAA